MMRHKPSHKKFGLKTHTSLNMTAVFDSLHVPQKLCRIRNICNQSDFGKKRLTLLFYFGRFSKPRPVKVKVPAVELLTSCVLYFKASDHVDCVSVMVPTEPFLDFDELHLRLLFLPRWGRPHCFSQGPTVVSKSLQLNTESSTVWTGDKPP